MAHQYDQVDGAANQGVNAESARQLSEAEQKSRAAYAAAEKLTSEAYREEHAKQQAQEAARPIRDRLSGDIENLESQLQRSHRARQILDRHPEFAELIELLGLIRVPLRVSPVQSARALVTE